ncbi:MAG TPA: chorismate mutase [bacterium]|nr:chorismate mutase [bacterium]
MHIRGIRGATTAPANTAEAILEATRELLAAIVDENRVEADEIAAVLFTCTEDLTAAFPAEAGRALGWADVPLITAREIDVPGAVARCIRVLIFWNTPLSQEEVAHIYLRGAESLRPDLARSTRRGRAPTPHSET